MGALSLTASLENSTVNENCKKIVCCWDNMSKGIWQSTKRLNQLPVLNTGLVYELCYCSVLYIPFISCYNRQEIVFQALIIARSEKEALEVQVNRLQHKVKDLGEDYRMRLIKYIEDISVSTVAMRSTVDLLKHLLYLKENWKKNSAFVSWENRHKQ